MRERLPGTVWLACAALLAGTACASWTDRFAAARDDVTPEDVLAGRIPEGDVVWVGRCLGPAPGTPWYLEFEWIPGPWRALRPALDRTVHLPRDVGEGLVFRPTSMRFLFLLDARDALIRRSDPNDGLPTDGEFACVGPVEVRFGRATVCRGESGLPYRLRPALTIEGEASPAEGGPPR